MQLEASEERIEGLESTSAAHNGEGTEKTYRRNTTRCKEDAAIVGRIFLVVRDVRYQTLNVQTDSFSSGGFLQTLHRAFEKPLVIGLCPQSRTDKYCAHLCTTYWIYCARFCKGVVCWTMILLRYCHCYHVDSHMLGTCFLLHPYWHVTSHKVNVMPTRLQKKRPRPESALFAKTKNPEFDSRWLTVIHNQPKWCLPKIIILQGDNTLEKHLCGALLYFANFVPPKLQFSTLYDGDLDIQASAQKHRAALEEMVEIFHDLPRTVIHDCVIVCACVPSNEENQLYEVTGEVVPWCMFEVLVA